MTPLGASHGPDMKPTARVGGMLALLAALSLAAPSGAADIVVRIGGARTLLPESLPAAARCLAPPMAQAAEAPVEGLGDRLENAEVLGGYLQGLIRGSGVVFCLDGALDGCRGYYDPDFNVIGVRPDLTAEEKLLIVVHELRHLDQYGRGYGMTIEVARLEMVRQTYALEADAQAIVTLFAWSERAAGRPGPWEALLGLEHYEDIPRAFEGAMAAQGDLAAAMRAAFAQWYASEWRRERYFLTSCTRYLDALEANRRVEHFEMLPPDHFDTLCVMPDGSNYGCHLTEEIRIARPRRD